MGPRALPGDDRGDRAALEAALAKLVLERYVTWSARARHLDRIPGAVMKIITRPAINPFRYAIVASIVLSPVLLPKSVTRQPRCGKTNGSNTAISKDPLQAPCAVSGHDMTMSTHRFYDVVT